MIPLRLHSSYQSYQSGIETALKSLSLQSRTSYQSYQSGIETVMRSVLKNPPSLPIVPIWNWNIPEVNNRRREYVYQSYQSGIETLIEFKLWKEETTTNRTNLELKLRHEDPAFCSPCYQSYQSGIETTRWNLCLVNLISTNRTNLELKQAPATCAGYYRQATNRTNLELKHPFPGIYKCTNVLPIVPIWNWNFAY